MLRLLQSPAAPLWRTTRLFLPWQTSRWHLDPQASEPSATQLSRQDNLKETKNNGPLERHILFSFVNILQETIYKATMWSSSLNVSCGSVIGSIRVRWRTKQKHAFAAYNPAFQQLGTKQVSERGKRPPCTTCSPR